DADGAPTPTVHLEHDVRGLRDVLVEKTHEDFDDELLGRVVVVVEDHDVPARLVRLGTFLRREIALVLGAFGLLGRHGECFALGNLGSGRAPCRPWAREVAVSPFEALVRGAGPRCRLEASTRSSLAVVSEWGASRGTRCRGAAWVLVQSRDRRWRPYKAAPPVPDGGDGRSRWVPTDGQVAVFGGVLGLPAASFSAARFRAHSTFFLVRRAFWRRRARASWGVDMTSSSWACDEGPAECTRPTKSGPPPSPTRRWTPGGPDIVSHLPGVSRAEQGPEIRRLRGLGPLVLLPEAGVVGRSLLREQHPEGHRELREWHAGEQVGQRGVRFVVDQDVLLRDDVSARVGRAEGDDLEAQRPWIQAEALVVLLAEQERLPVLDQQLPLLLVLLAAERLEGAVVEDVAVLVDLREGRSAVRRGAAQHHGEVLGLRVDGA